ncbi:hypothetical protein [Rosistilla oblonga]|uniref:hypothetical protein n=1 Tax=Rosistilla oblonga TaxID=2527990 RepID=UPI003A96FCA3
MSLAVAKSSLMKRGGAIAGGNLAAGDTTLDQTSGSVAKSAAKAPYWTGRRVDQRLVDAPADESAQALLDLSSRLGHPFYTGANDDLGRPGTDRDVEPRNADDSGFGKL